MASGSKPLFDARIRENQGGVRKCFYISNYLEICRSFRGKNCQLAVLCDNKPALHFLRRTALSTSASKDDNRQQNNQDAKKKGHGEFRFHTNQ